MILSIHLQFKCYLFLLGRLLCSSLWPNLRPVILTGVTVTISPDSIGVRDQTDERSVHLFDTSTGKPINEGNTVYAQIRDS